jgi:hypothetical protein
MNRIQAPSIVVCRGLCEKIVGYDARLSLCADRNLWKQIREGLKASSSPTMLAHASRLPIGDGLPQLVYASFEGRK